MGAADAAYAGAGANGASNKRKEGFNGLPVESFPDLARAGLSRIHG